MSCTALPGMGCRPIDEHAEADEQARADEEVWSVITLDAVESSFPERIVTVEERAVQLGLTAAKTHMFRRVNGLDRMHYDAEASFDDIVLPPARRLLKQADPATIRYLIYAYAAHGATGAPADTAQRLRRSLGLRSATAFAITQQNCAIPLTAIDLAGTLLAASGDPAARALIVTGEKLTPRQARQVETVMLADGAASCLVSTNGRGAQVLSFATRTRGEYYDGLHGTRAQFRAAAEERPKLLREVMTEAAAEAGYRLSDMQLIVPPNQGLPFWSGTLDSEELIGKAFFENNARHSHCLAADLFINYATLTRQQRWEPGRPSLFVATGLGWTYSAMVLLPVPTQGRRPSGDSGWGDTRRPAWN